MYNVYVEIYGESLMLQEYLEEQLLTPIRSKVRQDVGLEEPNSRLRRSWYGPTLDKLREELGETSQLSNYCWSTTLGKYWLTVSGFLSRSSPSVLRGLKAHAVSGTRDAIAPHDPHHLLGCPSRPVKAMRIAKPG